MRHPRLFLAFASVWDLAVGTIAVTLPEGRVPDSRRNGVLVLVFGALFGVLALRPWRPLIVVGAIAKALGTTSSTIGLAQGKRDVVTWLALGDAAWLPGFVALSRR